MDDGAGPSGIKRVRKQNKLYNFYSGKDLKELEKLLYESEDEDILENEAEVYSSSDEEYRPETDFSYHRKGLKVGTIASDHSSSEFSEENLPETLLPNQSPVIMAATAKAKSKTPKTAKPPSPRWTEDTSSMKNIHFTKRREFLVIPEGIFIYLYEYNVTNIFIFYR